ncbi:MAG: hypothetical protein EON59_02865 [Alphaproteobacteria bacterium]|nr:MAG: hypothetical protein EON59_02865 [Alphaproteobacteria bacterium]
MVSLLALILYPALGGCDRIAGLADDGSRGAIAACQDATRSKLVSPSSFKSLWANFTERGPLDLADRDEWMNRDICSVKRAATRECTQSTSDKLATAVRKQGDREIAAKRRRGEKLDEAEQAYFNAGAWLDTAKTGFVLLEYDAENRMGANLRSFAICRFGPPGDRKTFSIRDIFQQGEIPRSEGEEAKAQYERLESVQ